jgi:Concanavalin A-like lectin/glucanases superfamily
MRQIGRLGRIIAGFCIFHFAFLICAHAQPMTLNDPALLIGAKSANVAGGGGSPSVVGGSPVPVFNPANLLNNLVAYYSFNNTANLGADSSGNGYQLSTNATVNDATGINGNAVTISSNNHLYVADNALFRIDGSTSYTIAGWFAFPTSAPAISIIVKSSANYELDWSSSSNVTFTVYKTTGGSYSAAVPVTSTNWVFIAAWYNLASGTVNISINNGTPSTTVFSGTPGTSSSNADLDFDGSPASPSVQYGFDEVAFWNRLLSSAELNYLYNSGAGNFYPF